MRSSWAVLEATTFALSRIMQATAFTAKPPPRTRLQLQDTTTWILIAPCWLALSDGSLKSLRCGNVLDPLIGRRILVSCALSCFAIILMVLSLKPNQSTESAYQPYMPRTFTWSSACRSGSECAVAEQAGCLRLFCFDQGASCDSVHACGRYARSCACTHCTCVP